MEDTADRMMSTPPSTADGLTTAEWDDDLLYEECVDPFAKVALASREEGRAAGLRDGYLDGLTLGRTKGWELGLELGYVGSFAGGILSGYEPPPGDDGTGRQGGRGTSHRTERCLTLARELVRLVDEFPEPEELLGGGVEDARGDDRGTSDAGEGPVEGPASDDAAGRPSDSSDTPASHPGSDTTDTTAGAASDQFDVEDHLQRIRAKFKLFCVLLRTERPYDLKSVLERGRQDGPEEAARRDVPIAEAAESDW